MKFDEMCQAVRDFWMPNKYNLDEFPILEGEKKPFALILPGGGYKMVCSFVEGLPYAKALNKKGYAAFVLKYRTSNKAKFPAPIEDVSTALKYIIANADSLNVDINNYSVWSSSAGGHLAGCFSTGEIGYKKYNLPKPTATILAYPVVTMGNLTHSDSRKYFLGNEPSSELIQKTSVENLVDDNYPSTYVWYSLEDKIVNPKNSKILINAFEENDIYHKSHEFKTGAHGIGLGIGTECEPWFNEAVEFWRSASEE